MLVGAIGEVVNTHPFGEGSPKSKVEELRACLASSDMGTSQLWDGPVGSKTRRPLLLDHRFFSRLKLDRIIKFPFINFFRYKRPCFVSIDDGSYIRRPMGRKAFCTAQFQHAEYTGLL
jgi:hypothetical protein